MAKKISELVAAAALDGSELFELVQNGANVKGVLGAVLPLGYIDGFKLQWSGANAITVSSGTATIPGLGRAVRVATPLALSGLNLSASTWYHLYLFLSNAVPTLECVTTAPAAPYSGTACAKTGDASRRYIGSVLTDGNGAIFNFAHNVQTGLISYQVNLGPAPFMVGNGNATVATDVDCSAVVPVTSRMMQAIVANNSTGSQVYIGNSIMPPTNTTFLAYIGPLANNIIPLSLDANRKFQYLFTSVPSSNFAARGAGYYFER